MWSPTEGYSTHGRYNSVGVSVLYCADDIEVIPYEHPKEGQTIDIVSIKVNTDLIMLYVSTLFKDFTGFLVKEMQKVSFLKSHIY